MSLREEMAERKRANAKALAAFGAVVSSSKSADYLRVIRTGGKVTIFTIGYERRTPEDLISKLQDGGIEVLADIREKPVSRRADFRADALQAACEQAGIEYQSWPSLGSKESLRDALRESGDIPEFQKEFRKYAERHLIPEVKKLAKQALGRPIALMCYERTHEDCHRMIIAELIAEQIDCGITAFT